MKKEEKLAHEIMKAANEIVHGNFKVGQRDDYFVVWKNLINKQGNLIEISCALKEEIVQPRVIVSHCKYDIEDVRKIIDSIGFPVFLTRNEEELFAIETSMNFWDFENVKHIIACRMMLSMAESTLKVLEEKQKK